MINAASIRSSLRKAVFLGAFAGAVVLRIRVPQWAEARLVDAIAESASHNPEREILQNRTVVLDAGHGGQDGGTAGNGVQEKAATLDITRRIEKQLDHLGIRVRMTRSQDAYVELGERCAVASKSNAAAFVSIHLNASSAKNVAGIETYFCSQRAGVDASPAPLRPVSMPAGTREDHRAELLAGLIQRRACNSTGAQDRAVRDSRLFVVMHASCPAVLVECGYLTNSDEARRLRSDRYKDKLAAAIADGIRHYLVATAINPRRGFGPSAAGRDMASAAGVGP